MRYLKYSGIVLLIVLSFYFTDKIIIYMENINPLMIEIVDKSSLYETRLVNAVVEGNTIIPGLSGKNINPRKSFLQMGEFGSFNETFLVYDSVKPEISLKDHQDKVIIRGNPIKRSISLVVEPTSRVEIYLEENKIPYTIIANIKIQIERGKEYINGETDVKRSLDLHSLLNSRKANANLCLLGYSNLDFCIRNKYFLISPTINSSMQINELLNQIRSGAIILIKQNFSLVNLDLVLREIKRQDLKIVYLSDLICENNN